MYFDLRHGSRVTRDRAAMTEHHNDSICFIYFFVSSVQARVFVLMLWSNDRNYTFFLKKIASFRKIYDSLAKFNRRFVIARIDL